MVKCAENASVEIRESDDYRFNFGCVALEMLMTWQIKHMSVNDCTGDLNHACWKLEYPGMIFTNVATIRSRQYIASRASLRIHLVLLLK